MPGWGFIPWGTGPWGGFPGLTYVLNAYAASVTAVRVFVVGNPQVISEWTPGDTLNPASWSVTRPDTGDEWTVIKVEMMQPPGVLPGIFDVIVLEPFESTNVVHRVDATDVVDIVGVLFSPPRTYDFAGVIDEAVSTPEKQATARDLAIKDLANPPFISEEYVGGTLRINDIGDYVNEEGVSLARKLIFRRLTTFQGGFFHLPAYGLPLSPKTLLTSSDLIMLKAEIERQIMKEDEVEAASASITLDSDGILTAVIKARIRPGGQEVTVNAPLPVTAVSL